MQHDPIAPWKPESWRERTAAQQVDYPDQAALARVLSQLERKPPLVSAGEIEACRLQIAAAAEGNAFILQGGDCVERFCDCDEAVITNKLKILLQMSVILTHGARRPVVRIARIAGQHTKPRSKHTEQVNGHEVLTYRGDSVHGFEATPEARRPDPDRLMGAYHASAVTLNFIRSMIDGGFADLHHPYSWNLHGVERSARWPEYQREVEQILDAIHFMESFGGVNAEKLDRVSFYTSHEGLHLPYEQALTRRDAHGRALNLGAHMLWIGDRTRQPDGAHVEYFRGIGNPIGIKVGPGSDPQQLARTITLLDPDREPGRVTVITRLGRDRAAAELPGLVRAVKATERTVAWSCDPMHGNTVTVHGRKTRRFDDVLEELSTTFACHQSLSSVLAGVHFELTGEDVTECLGGSAANGSQDLDSNYQSFCDPRLNYDQSLEMAFLIAAVLRKRVALSNGRTI